MNISEKSKKIADSCRFCWMCHHICPVGNATGAERNTARARGLAVSLAARGAASVTADMLDNMYECTLCGGCTNDCVTGWDPTVFVKELRTSAALDGILPDYVLAMLDNIEKTGNVYGKTELCSRLTNAVAAQSKNSKTLFYLGSDARYVNCAAACDAIEALKKTGAEFSVLIDEPDSGYASDTLIGAVDETVKMMKAAAAVLNKYERVIVFDPADMKSFRREYKEYGVELTCKTITFTEFCAAAVENGNLKLKNTGKSYTYQDSALLAREVGETLEPRTIISACGELKEMLLHGKETMFAGNLIMNEYAENTMKLIARQRWKDAEKTGAHALVTASPSEYMILAAVQPSSMELVSIEQLILL